MTSREERLAQKYKEIMERAKATKEELKKLQREQDRKAKIAERKARNQLLFQVGGLVEIADLLHTDKGALLGALLSVSYDLKTGPDSVKFQEWKTIGDKHLADREAARMAAKKKPVEA